MDDLMQRCFDELVDAARNMVEETHDPRATGVARHAAFERFEVAQSRLVGRCAVDMLDLRPPAPGCA